MRPQWQYDALARMDWHYVVVGGAALAFGAVVWLLMTWAEHRWNRDTVKRRRLR